MSKLVFFSSIMMLVLLFGCVDISGSAKAGNFGSSEKEQKALGYFNEKYGDLSQKGGTPRIIEPLVTTDIVENMPVDIVSKFSKDAPEMNVWFVYDDFDEGNEIEVKWVYKNTNETIYSFTEKTGPDFGRGSFTLEMPDNGWPLGEYSVLIAGRSASKTVSFEVIDGATVSQKIPYLEEVQPPQGDTQPEPEPIPPVQGADEQLFSNGNIGACDYTDTSTFTLEEEVFVSKLRMWYYWGAGETTLPYTLTLNGEEFASGELERASCDPYQTSWCEANYYANKNFPAGAYVLKAGSAKLCQNAESGGNGMYIIYGKKLGAAAAPPAGNEIGTQTDSGFTVKQTTCSFAGDWSSNWGAMTFAEENGRMTAVYTHDSGKIDSIVTGNILVGKWSESPSYSEPGDAGDVELELSEDCSSFTGNWRYGSAGNWSGGWTGTRS